MGTRLGELTAAVPAAGCLLFAARGDSLRYMVKIAPSLLAADFARLADDVGRIEDHVEMLHVDVMDGHFVPNLSLGMPVIRSLRAITDLPFDCHLMVTNPTSLLGPIAEAGATLVTVHLEVHPDPVRVAAEARSAGLEFGIVVNPSTPYVAAEPYLELCDMFVVMSVVPGFGGQTFMPEVLSKVEAARKFLDFHGLGADIEVDGGITPATAPQAVGAGADVLVAGTAVFRDPDPVAAVQRLRTATEEDG
jgi:ribulose-phosphate 3-epimerase